MPPNCPRCGSLIATYSTSGIICNNCSLFSNSTSITNNTIYDELENIFNLLSNIEGKLFFPTPLLEQVEVIQTEKTVIIKNDLIKIADKLRKIDNTLNLIDNLK